MEDQLILRDYYEKLGVKDTEIFEQFERGTIKKVYVAEDDKWLILSADYFKMKKGIRYDFSKIPILKFRINNNSMRKYILHIILNNNKKLGTGTISNRILRIPIIRFSKNDEKNLKTIETIMEKYLKNLKQKKEMTRKISELNRKINHKIYGFYGLTNDEIAIIELPLGNQ